MKKGSVAIVPGSFDPITYGHIDIAKRAAELYDTVYFAIMVNSQKQYMFTMEQRKRLAEAAFEGSESIKVISSEGMLWKLAYDLDAEAIVKGYRNQTDYDYEMKMSEFNKSHNPKAQTVLLKTADTLVNVSSTVVRERILNNESLSELMPDSVEKLIYEFLKN